MLPNSTLSLTPQPAPFLPPRGTVRFSPLFGQSDVHFGGVAISDPSQGVSFQLWTAFIQGGDILLTAPNTPAFVRLPGVNAVWVALAFDQNAREFIAYADKFGNASFVWFDTLINNFRTTALAGVVPRVFAAFDDSRPVQLPQSDVILAYVRGNELFFRAQRERFVAEHDLGPAPATLVQVGMNQRNRFQFAFQNVQGSRVLPPAEFSPGAVK